ncbi:MAG: hypothetical protein H7Y38_12075 [Armatimonadetes bacterium]|nr:hypothetical protein [Armatimonadota bacterium]
MLYLPVCLSLALVAGLSAPISARDDKPLATNVVIYPNEGLAVADKTDSYIPAQTRVAVLPAVDRTGERAENRRQAQAKAVYENMIEQFTKSGFVVVPQAEVNAAISEAGMDLNDEEAYRRDNFIAVAGAVNADLVIFAAVTDASQGTKSGVFNAGEKEGKARVKFWLLDAKKKKAIYSAVIKEGKAGGASKLFATNEGSNRQINAAGNAVKELLEPFLKPYAPAKK